MRILIIGASGLVGGNCMRYFTEATDWTVKGTYYSYDAKDTVFYDTLNPENENNFDVEGFQPDVVLHCGALTHVDYCEEHQEESYEKTVRSTANVIDLCNRHGSKMVFISTDYVFDGDDGPYDEEAAVHAISIYGKHKLEAEEMVRAKVKDHLVIRVTNIYGDEERGKNFISRILSQIFDGKRLTLKLPADQYATPINARDIARSLHLLIRDGKAGIYNVAGTDYMSRVQLALRILKHFPNAPYDLFALSTSELHQKAPRPLQGGLKNKKLMHEYPDFRFSTVDDYMEKEKKRRSE